MWRGLMLTKAVEQFLRDVRWGELDDLLIDMPPGTGDVQMGLARLLPRADMVIVTTPALAAQKVAQRAADMARRSFVRVVGVIENMSDFTCEHGTSLRRCSASAAAPRWPTRSACRCSARSRSSRRCRPAATPAARWPSNPAPSPAAAAFARHRRPPSTRVVPRTSSPTARDMAGCSARLLDAVEAAVDVADVQAGRPSRAVPPTSGRELVRLRRSGHVVVRVDSRRSGRGHGEVVVVGVAGEADPAACRRRRAQLGLDQRRACRRRRRRPARRRTSAHSATKRRLAIVGGIIIISPASAWAMAVGGRTHMLWTVSASSCTPSWSSAARRRGRTGCRSDGAAPPRASPSGRRSGSPRGRAPGRRAGTAPPSTASPSCTATRSALVGRRAARRRAVGRAAARPPRSTRARRRPEGEAAVLDAEQSLDAAASSRPSQYGSSSAAPSTSSTRPPGNTYIPAAKAASAWRRSTNTSTPVASASRTDHTVAAGRRRERSRIRLLGSRGGRTSGGSAPGAVGAT